MAMAWRYVQHITYSCNVQKAFQLQQSRGMMFAVHLTKKQVMELNDNELTGQLPDAWSTMKKLSVSPLTDRMTADV